MTRLAAWADVENWMPIRLEDDELRRRVVRVQKMLQPLAGVGKQVACAFAPNPRCRIICGRPSGPIDDPTNRWFGTFARTVQAQYHEIWYPERREEHWWLERAYFGIREIINPVVRPKEILCIHSDPGCRDAEPLGSYKRGPHLHVSVGESPLTDAHFPLNLGHLQEILSTCGSLSEAMAAAIKVVCVEVLARMS